MVIDEYKHIEKISLLLKRNEFAKKLDDLIADKKTNSFKVANDMSVTHTTVKRYLNGYPPKKGYAIRLCIALDLSREKAKDLLDSAGIVFSPNCNRDIVFEYIINHINLATISVTELNNFIDDLIVQNQNNYKTKRKIDKIELL